MYLRAMVVRTSSAPPELSVTFSGVTTLAAMAPPPPGMNIAKPPWLFPSGALPLDESRSTHRPSSEYIPQGGAARMSGRFAVRTR